jgi:hypothetical protein
MTKVEGCFELIKIRSSGTVKMCFEMFLNHELNYLQTKVVKQGSIV